MLGPCARSGVLLCKKTQAGRRELDIREDFLAVKDGQSPWEGRQMGLSLGAKERPSLRLGCGWGLASDSLLEGTCPWWAFPSVLHFPSLLPFSR